MRAVVWHGAKDVRVDEVPDPRIERPTDAIVRITSTAICGSDLHLYGGLVPFLFEGDILGHEPMGIVQEVGSEVRSLKTGDRVVVPFNVACGSCAACGRGLTSQCETTRDRQLDKGGALLGYTHAYGGLAGGQAEYLRVPHADAGPIVVPEGPPDERFLLLSDVLPTAWQGVVYAGVAAGDTVAVWGLGPIGQMSARVALHRGAARVFGVDRVPERVAMAQRHGIETIDASGTFAVDAIKDLTGGRGVDAAIDCVGMEADGSMVEHALQKARVQPDRLSALRECMGVIRRGGTLSVVGVYLGAMQMFPLGDLFDKQLTIRMGQANVRAWDREIVPLLTDEDPLAVHDLVTHRLPLADAAGAYEIFRAKRDGAIKVVLTP